MMRELLEGWKNFRQRVLPGKQQLFSRLAKGQHPQAVFVTCSDSRIVPELMTQTEPGELFVLRNAGNIIPPSGTAGAGGEGATLEFAINALKVPSIIVCGHTGCGAIQGLLNPDSTTQLPVVAEWLEGISHVREAVQRQYGELDAEQLLLMAVRENVRAQLQSLRTYPFISQALAEGRLTTDGWVYHIETGELEVLDPEQNQFVHAESISLKSNV